MNQSCGYRHICCIQGHIASYITAKFLYHICYCISCYEFLKDKDWQDILKYAESLVQSYVKSEDFKTLIFACKQRE